LIGIPFRVTIGRKIADGRIEVRNRRTKESVEVDIESAVEFILNLINEEKARYKV